METGKMVVLLNLDNLYESLYDALNQVIINLCQAFGLFDTLFRIISSAHYFKCTFLLRDLFVYFAYFWKQSDCGWQEVLLLTIIECL
jgi:hypothetical protein